MSLQKLGEQNVSFQVFCSLFSPLEGSAEEPLNARRGDNRPSLPAVLEQMGPHSPGLGLRYFLLPRGTSGKGIVECLSSLSHSIEGERNLRLGGGVVPNLTGV